MKRRTLLAATAAATTTGVAGCLRSGGLGASNDPETDDLNTGDPADDETRLADRTFDVESVECGSEYGDHEVIKEDGTVTIEGTLDGNNTCYTAELLRGEYATDEDTLYVEVESIDDSQGNEACSSCIVEIDYVATFEFENGEPESVRVDQRGETSGSSSASKSVSGGDGGSDTPTDSPTETEYPGTPTPTPD